MKKEEAAGMFITDGKSVLLLRRNEKGKEWGLPGGHAKKEKEKVIESSIQTARREVEEEIGKFPPKMEHFGRFVEKDDEYIWTTYLMKVNRKFGGIKLSNEHTEYMWMPFEEAPNYKLHPKLVKQLGKYIFHTRDKFGENVNFKEYFSLLHKTCN